MLSLLLVVAIAVATYVFVQRGERQECVNAATARLLEERGRAIDSLIDAVIEANDRLQTADEDAKIAARRDLDARLEQVKRARDEAKRQADLDQGVTCG